MTEGAAPAERYAAARTRARAARTELARYGAGLDIVLDDFQEAGCRAVENGRSVLVAAPTGAGKTIVGQFACHLALATGRKAFYTTPIKALSNQKYLDLVAVHGHDRVGLLTGDQSINASAPLLVMTTEVLRNMLYAGSEALTGLGYAIMDEVHYLADRYRGGVWEEVIIHLPATVQVIALSATVSNAEEFGDWLEAVRGHVTVVVSEHRPVPLTSHVAVSAPGSTRILDLYDPATTASPTPRINPEIPLALRSAPQGGDHGPRGGSRGRGRGGGRGGGKPRRVAVGRRHPSRTQVTLTLAEAGMLPAIYFVFSRAGCDGAVRQLMTAGVRLTTPHEAEEIRQVVQDRTAHLDPGDLAAIGIIGFTAALTRGVAAHHAGMLPLFKETVEELFTRGLVKIVFATETLALGINMPARTVVLERLVKWDGSSHVAITPGEYTQLTGRAGRRGIDTHGHALVVDHAGMDPVDVAGLASKRTYPLNSSFAPTVNMAVNLTDRLGVAHARDVLEMSFAQFQADRGVVGLARKATDLATAIDGYAAAMTCEAGDIGEYEQARERLTAARREQARSRRAHERDRARTVMDHLEVGDVVSREGRWVVVTGPGDVNSSLTVVTASGKVRSISAASLVGDVATRIRVRRDLNVRVPAHRRALSESLRETTRTLGRAPTPHHEDHDDEQTVRDLAALVQDHPCHTCPDREAHARWAARWRDATRDHGALTRRIGARTGHVAREFDRLRALLTELGYMDEDGTRVTADGRWLGRLYAENDLLIAQCVRTGAWKGADPRALAALVAAVVYTGRGEQAERVPAALTTMTEATTHVWSLLDDQRVAHGLSSATDLDFGLVAPIWRWAGGDRLPTVLADADLGAGDFVRWCKQVIDVLDQLAASAPDPQTRRAAATAITTLSRGVVALAAV